MKLELSGRTKRAKRVPLGGIAEWNYHFRFTRCINSSKYIRRG